MDNSDEENCTNTTSTAAETTTKPCNSLTEFTCENGYRQCVPKDSVCNKINDCGDGSDEDLNLCPPVKCNYDEFRCLDNRKCIEKASVCDSIYDCRDGSDEINCHVTTNLSSQSDSVTSTTIAVPNPPFTTSSPDFASLPNLNLPCPFGLKRPHSMCLTPIRFLFDRFQQVDKNEVLNRHNYFRRQAIPQPRQLLPDLQWDDDLARTAAGWAAQCANGKDDSTNRALPDRAGNKTSWQVGQNICKSPTSTKTVSECIDEWAAERQNWVYGIGQIGDGTVGHYTQ